MRFAVESWAPELGPAVDAEQSEPSPAAVNPAVELPPDRWGPLTPGGPAARTVRFVDGVRRVDARVWITGDDGVGTPGIAASYAAGTAHCDGRAVVERVQVRRAVLSSAPDLDAIRTPYGDYRPGATGHGAEALPLGLQQRMGELETLVTADSGDADLLVVDGPLRRRPALPGAVGYVKSHHTSYLAPELAATVGRLAAGQRTPLFLISAGRTRYSWYARLTAPEAQPWSGVVRGEASGDMSPADAQRLADLATVTLPRFASAAHKDARAPQNLYPVAGLERELRRRLGDPGVLFRALLEAGARRGAARR